MYYQSQTPTYCQFLLDGEQYVASLTRLIASVYQSVILDPDPPSRGQRNWIDLTYWALDPNFILPEGILPHPMVNRQGHITTRELWNAGGRPGRNGMTLKGALWVLANAGVRVRIFMWQPDSVEGKHDVAAEIVALCRLMETPYVGTDRLTGGLGNVPNIEIYTAVHHAGPVSSFHQKYVIACSAGCITVLAGGLNLTDAYVSATFHTDNTNDLHDTGYLLRGDAVIAFMTDMEHRVHKKRDSQARAKPLKALSNIVSGLRRIGHVAGPEMPPDGVFNPPPPAALAVARQRRDDSEDWGFVGPTNDPLLNHMWQTTSNYNRGRATGGVSEVLGAGDLRQGYSRLNVCAANAVEICTTKADVGSGEHVETDIKKKILELVRGARTGIYIENYLLHDPLLIELLSQHVFKSVSGNPALPPVPGNPPIPLRRIVVIHEGRADHLIRNAALYMTLSSQTQLSVQISASAPIRPFGNVLWSWQAGRLNTSASGADFCDTSVTIAEKPNPLYHVDNLETHRIALRDVLNATGGMLWYAPFLSTVANSPVSVHSKLMVVDDTTYIGSANFNYRSFNLDGEIGAFIRDRSFSFNVLNKLGTSWGLIAPENYADPISRFVDIHRAAFLRPISLDIRDTPPMPRAVKIGGGWKIL